MDVDRIRDRIDKTSGADVLAARRRSAGTAGPTGDLQHATRAVGDDREDRRPSVVAVATGDAGISLRPLPTGLALVTLLAL
jgi:hypothetical protein